MLKQLVVLSIAVMTLSGCTYRLGGFTALSSKNVPLRYDTSTHTSGKACKLLNFLVVPLGPPSLEDAIDDAIGDRGNALVNQVTYQSAYWVVVGTYMCWEVKGDVVTIQ